MAKQILTPAYILPGRHSAAGKKNRHEKVFQRLLQRTRFPAEGHEILTVHGSMEFNAGLDQSVSRGGRVLRLNQRLREFHAKPGFRVVFYTVSRAGSDLENVLEDLCYCRMLLRPGGVLFLVAKRDGSGRLTDYFTLKKRKELSWLRQAGYMSVTVRAVNNEMMILSGYRPKMKF